MTAADLGALLAAEGVDATGLEAAVVPVADWIAAVPADEVTAGLGAAAEPLAALHGLACLHEAALVPPQPGSMAPLLHLLGGSPALARVLIGEGSGWPALLATVLEVPTRTVADHLALLAAAGVVGPLPRDALQAGLRRHRARELVRIGGRDLLGLAGVDDTVREISALAEGMIGAATGCVRARLAAEWDHPPVAFCVVGMGKLGGEELNYSSDIDLVYIYERDAPLADGRTIGQLCCRVAEETTRALSEVTADGLCFRVDLRLRPGGSEGPVAIALPAAVAYYESWGQTWERAVWLKARPVAGERALGEALQVELAPFVYRRYLDFATIEDLKAMKRRVDASLRDADAARRDVKLGRGGIREVEFLVQAQQLVHGGKDPRLHVRGTLAALTALARAGYVDTGLAERLAAAYRFLRDVEHKIQVVHTRQTQLLPSTPEEELALARRLGFRGPGALVAFRTILAAHREAVRAAFDGLFHGAEEERRRDEQPELAVLVDTLAEDGPTRAHLARLGFRDVDAALHDLRLLRDGPPHAPASARRRQALATLAPALLAEIARSAAADRALHHLATFISTVGARTSYLHLLLENPGVMRLLVRLFATSEYLSAFFLRHPELLDSLMRADLVRLEWSQEEMARELDARLAAAPDLETELDTLRRFRHEEFLRIGVHDIQGSLAPETVGVQLTQLAEVCLAAALALGRREVLQRSGVPPGPPSEELAVLGMGKLGSGELNYASDLDLIFIYDAGDVAWWAARPAPREIFTRIAQRAMSALQTPTREGIAYRIDTRLRPSGNQGPLVSPLEAFAEYHRTSARLWERQALVRARVLVAPPALRARLEVVIAECVYGCGLTAAEVQEIAAMRQRIEHERGADANHIKTGRGGLIDVEFLVQMLQLRHGHDHPRLRTRVTLVALAELAAAGLLPAEEAEALRAGYAFLRALENRLRLERDQPVEAMDDDPATVLSLARRLKYEGSNAQASAALRADHARQRDTIRAIYERRFAEAGR